MAINIPVDFTGVESRGRIRVSEGDYLAKVVKLEQKPSAQKKTPGLHITFEGLSGELRGKRITDSHWLTKDSLWTLRNMLEAMGFQVPSGPMKLTEKMLKGRKVGLTIIDGEEYKGRISSEIGDYINPSIVGNVTKTEDALDEEEDEDGLGVFADDDEDNEPEVVETEDESDADDEEDEESFGFDEDDEEESDEDETLSFSAEDVSTAKAPELKAYVKEATEAGWELELGTKPKLSEVREALLSLFADDEDDDEMEGFSLDDV